MRIIFWLVRHAIIHFKIPAWLDTSAYSWYVFLHNFLFVSLGIPSFSP